MNETVSYGTETEEIGVVYALDPEAQQETAFEPITAEAMKALNA